MLLLLYRFFDFFPFDTTVHWRVRIRFDSVCCREKKWKHSNGHRDVVTEAAKRQRCFRYVRVCVCGVCCVEYEWRGVRAWKSCGDVARKIQYKQTDKHTHTYTVRIMNNNYNRCCTPANDFQTIFTSYVQQCNWIKRNLTHKTAC